MDNTAKAVMLELRHIVIHLKKNCLNINSYIEHHKIPRLPDVYKCNYSDNGFLLLDLKSLAALNQHLALDCLQISLVMRNQKIEIDSLSEAIKWCGIFNKDIYPYRYLINHSNTIKTEQKTKSKTDPILREIAMFVVRMNDIIVIVEDIIKEVESCADANFSDYRAYDWPINFYKRGEK